ncbi:MAG: site-specific DNA-methyltransferase [Desulfobulbaceae bacterium]
MKKKAKKVRKVRKAAKSAKTASKTRVKGAGKKEINACPEVRTFALSELHEAPYNPRVISDGALEGLAASIRRFGCVEPIIVNVRDGRNIIIGGHQRRKVLLAQGAGEALCVVVDLDEKQEKLLNLSLNNPEIQGQFIDAIGEYIDQLSEEVGDAALLDLKINLLKGEIEGQGKEGAIPDDEIPPAPENVITQPGDLWLLGEHRLLCGDSTDPAAYERLMDGRKAALLATDPPYCVDYTGNDRPKAGKDWSAVYKETEIKNAMQFHYDFYAAAFEHLLKNTAMYLWHASARRPEIHQVCQALGILVHQEIIWVKPIAVLTYSFFSWQHEPCLLMWRKGHKPPYRPQHKSLGTVWVVGFEREGDPTAPEYYTDVWVVDWDGKKRQPGDIEHPTVKPVELFARPMRVHTRPGDICLEPFSGSGTQIIAAEKLERRCFAIEKEPHFVDVAVKRWEAWTGRKAKREKMKRRRGR